ncbi:MAG: family 10 glycosylhydrolase [Myxococcota bacterium]
MASRIARWTLVALLIALGTACKPEQFRREREPLPSATTDAADRTGASGPATPGDSDEAADLGVVPDTNGKKADRPLPPPAKPGRPPVRGLWVLAEGSVRVLDDAARVAPLIARAVRLGATDLFVQVYRGGRAFYPADPAFERAPAADRDDVDVLGRLLDAAHAQGLRVHAWVNVLSLSQRRDARMIADLGREAIHVDRAGRSLLDYPDFDLPQPDRRFYRMGTPGLYLDPAVPSVRARLVATFADLVERYPALDGLHLDYIRHPDVLPFIPGSRFGVGLEFGYGAISRARYRAETGQPDPIEGAPPGVVRGANAWDDWRRTQVTTLVEAIAQTVRARRPGLMLSAAVIPYVERCYLSLAQDWPRWLETGSIDRAIPMVYTLDDQLLRYQLEGYTGLAGADRIWPGLGVWLFESNPAHALAQLATLRGLGFTGEVLFSDDAIAAAPALLEALSPADDDPEDEAGAEPHPEPVSARKPPSRPAGRSATTHP